MVRNFTGGSGVKSQARKFVSDKKGNTNNLRLSEDPNEIYGIATKIYGGGIFQINGIDGIERKCVIRKKFKMKKRDNNIILGTLVLAGLREWSSNNNSKDSNEMCDLLEVYNEIEKNKLFKIEPKLQAMSSQFSSRSSNQGTEQKEDILFTNEENYNDIISEINEIITLNEPSSLNYENEYEEINVDDI
jgi:translation initiation factor IF-1